VTIVHSNFLFISPYVCSEEQIPLQQDNNSGEASTSRISNSSSSHTVSKHKSKTQNLSLYLSLSYFSNSEFEESLSYFIGTIFEALNLGAPTCSCTHCGAFFWYEERLR
jgi:hypothetical protein